MVEKEPFIQMVKTLNPNAELISSRTLKKKVLQSYLEQVCILKRYLKNNVPGKISFTIDVWTTKMIHSFMAVRGHWINTEWVYETVLLDFIHVDCSHTGENLARLFVKTLAEFGITLAKVMAITLDNVSSNDTLMSTLENYGLRNKIQFSKATHHVRCMAHILNLAMQDILHSLEISPKRDPQQFDDSDVASDADDFDADEQDEKERENEDEREDEEDEEGDEEEIEEDDEEQVSETIPFLKLRKLVRKVRKSQNLRRNLRKQCKIYKMKPLTPIIDVSTRWNSSYKMIERALKLKAPLNALCFSDKSVSGLGFNDIEWNHLNGLGDLFKKFDRGTQRLSMARHESISSHVPILDWLISELKNFASEKGGVLEIAAQQGLEKLEKYKGLINVQDNEIPFVAVVLNPALKLAYFKQHNYGRREILEIQKAISLKLSDSANIDSEEEDTDDGLTAHMFQRPAISNPKEFERYLQLPLSSKKVDVLQFWKTNEEEFPEMSKLARNYFGIQSSSVAVERDFSAGADLIRPTRSSLNTKSIKALMCLKSWILFNNSLQGKSKRHS